jgi:hypothetical protein
MLERACASPYCSVRRARQVVAFRLPDSWRVSEHIAESDGPGTAVSNANWHSSAAPHGTLTRIKSIAAGAT